MSRGTEEELAYIRYSAKELLFHQAQQIDRLQEDVQSIKLHMVTRTELASTRRWAIGAVLAAGSTLAAVVGAFGVLT